MNVAVPMMHFGFTRCDSVDPREDQVALTDTGEIRKPGSDLAMNTQPEPFRSPGLDVARRPHSCQNAAPAAASEQFAPSIDAFEQAKKNQTCRQANANAGDGPELLPRFQPKITPMDSPTQHSAPASEDGSMDHQGSSEKSSEKHHCSTIRSDESLTTEQLRAYKELEQAEMSCEMKRLENHLVEERERSGQLQRMFTTELMGQKEAHARDVAALEDMIGKVLEENKRLSSMVEGLCEQAGHGDKDLSRIRSPSSTCASGDTPTRSPLQSGSSGEEAPTNSDSRHKGATLRRALLNKERKLNNDIDKDHPSSSEAEHTTDSEQIPSSDDAHRITWKAKPQLLGRPQPRKPQVYTAID